MHWYDDFCIYTLFMHTHYVLSLLMMLFGNCRIMNRWNLQSTYRVLESRWSSLLCQRSSMEDDEFHDHVPGIYIMFIQSVLLELWVTCQKTCDELCKIDTIGDKIQSVYCVWWIIYVFCVMNSYDWSCIYMSFPWYHCIYIYDFLCILVLCYGLQTCRHEIRQYYFPTTNGFIAWTRLW